MNVWLVWLSRSNYRPYPVLRVGCGQSVRAKFVPGYLVQDFLFLGFFDEFK